MGETIAVPATRFVFVHYHIFKNGGTTVESILRREFGPAFATPHGPNPNSVLDGSDLQQFLVRCPTISAISSHHLRYPKPPIRGTVIFDCCFLRHPLDRLVSLYNQFRRIESSDPLCIRARCEPPRRFMEYLLCESPHLVSEVQVTQLANGGAFARPAHESDLERAVQVFRDMAVPGVVEMFAESMVAAEYFLKPAFPELRLQYVPQNVSRPPREGASVEETLIDLWGADVYSDAVRLNQLDLELFRRAQAEIRRRLFLLPDLDSRMADFEARCVSLRASEEAPSLPLVRAASA